MKIVVAAIALIAASCSNQTEQPAPQSRANPSFFVGVDRSKLPEPARSAVAAAEKDIDLVLRGYPPACKGSPDSGESDGGTMHYKCKHYDLTVMRSMFQVGDAFGYIYGPIITFPGDYPISNVRFYTNEELAALMNHSDGR